MFYPFSYRCSLERLGLITASSVLPSWTSLIPFAGPSLSLLPFSVHYDASASVTELCKAVLTSPLVYVCAGHLIERCVHTSIFEAVDSSIIRPDNPNVQSLDAGDQDRMFAALGIKKRSSPLIRDAIHKLLAALGWALPSTTRSTQAQVPSVANRTDPLIEQTIAIGGTQITGLAPLEVPVVQAHEQPDSEPPGPDVITIPIDAVEEVIRPPTPPTPRAPDFNHEDNDPRIRITSREGIVEMEVRLPSRVLSSHTEVVDALALLEDQGATHLPKEPFSSPEGSSHHVTSLASEPAQMIGAIVKAQLVGIAMLPVKMITLRMIASHYLATHGSGVSRPIRPLFVLVDFSWRGVGVQASRIALCSTLELSIDLALWGLQYLAITQAGKRLFGWGTL